MPGYVRPEVAEVVRDLTSARHRCVIVRGAPGSGRTTLRRAVAAEAAALVQPCLVVLEGDCCSGAVPYASLRLALAEAGPPLAPIADSLIAADGIRAGTDGFLAALIGACSPSVVLVVDDLHLVDPDTTELLAGVLASAHRAGAQVRAVLCLPLSGPEVTPDEHLLAGLPDPVTYHLGPLTPSDVAAMAQAVLGAPVEPDLVDLLARASGGLPHGVVRMVQSLESGARLVRRDGRVGIREPDDLPLRVEPGMGSLVRLSTLERTRIAGALAVLGSTDAFAQAVAAEYLATDRAEVEATVAELHERHLLRATASAASAAEGPGIGMRFAAPVLRGELAATLGPLMRAGLHRLAARRIMAQSPQDMAGLGELAHHLAASIGPGDAADGALLATIAMRLMDVAPRRALELLDRALEAMPAGSPERSAAQRRRLRLLQRLGRHGQTIAEANALFHDANDPRAVDEAGGAVTSALLLTGRLSTAIEVGEQTMRRAPGQAHHTGVGLAAARILARRPEGIAELLADLGRSPSAAVRALAANGADMLAASLGDNTHQPVGPAHLDSLLTNLDPVQRAVAITHFALFQPLTGRLDTARHVTSDAVAGPVMPILLANDALDAMWRVGRALRQHAEGDWTAVVAQLDDLLAIGERWPALGVLVHWLDAELALQHDRFQGALALLNDLERVPALDPMLAATAVGALAASGHPDEARRLAHQELERDRASGTGLTRHRLAAMAYRLDDPAASGRRAIAAEMAIWGGPGAAPWPRVDALLVAAEAAGDPAQAVAAHAEAAAAGLVPLVHEATVIAAELGAADPVRLSEAVAWAGPQRHHDLFLRAYACLRGLQLPGGPGSGASPRGPRSSGPTDIERLLVITAARGETNQRIAERLGVGVGTVKTYLQRLYRKLEVSGRSEFVAVTAKTGWRS